jgi:hypothetical protein
MGAPVKARLLWGVLLFGLALATGCSSALAGTFDVAACGDAPSNVNRTWTSYNNNPGPGQLEVADECGTTGDFAALYARDALTCDATCPFPPENAEAGWEFTSPPGTAVTRLDYSRWLFKDADNDWEPAVVADGLVVESCTIVYPAVGCSAGVQRGARKVVSLPSTQNILVRIRCRPNSSHNCVDGSTLHQVAAVLYGATVTLSDPSAPSLTASAGSVYDNGYLTGTRSASFDATDNVGIRSARLYIDDVPRPSTTYPCDFTYAVPCSNQPVSLSLDTGTLADGTHSIRVAASDAASNEAKSTARTVTVDNGAPSAPANLAVDGGETHSTNGFAVTWSNPGGQVAPISAAHWRICDSVGTGCSTGTASGVGTSRLAGITVPGEGDWKLEVWLEDAAGNTDPTATASAWLRLHSPTEPEPTTTDPPSPTSDPAPAPGTAPASTAPATATAPFVTGTAVLPIASVRRSSQLALTSGRFRNGRLLLRGRVAAQAAGVLAIRLRQGRRVRTFRRHLRGGRFRLTLRVPRHRTRIYVRFSGSELFLPARKSLHLIPR